MKSNMFVVNFTETEAGVTVKVAASLDGADFQPWVLDVGSQADLFNLIHGGEPLGSAGVVLADPFDTIEM